MRAASRTDCRLIAKMPNRIGGSRPVSSVSHLSEKGHMPRCQGPAKVLVGFAHLPTV